MALVQANIMSNTLQRIVPIQAVVPVDKLAPVREKTAPSGGRAAQKPFKTLYLLHGLYGNYTDWVSRTRISELAEERNLAVVMPSGDNSFYVDRKASWNNYGEFVGRELVALTRKLFRLSDRREDTFIAGLSMGGFGAIRNGLKYRETFSHIAGFSSAVHLFEEMEKGKLKSRDLAYEESCYGPLAEALRSDNNPREIVRDIAARRMAGEDVPLPRIYLSCGTEDPLIKANRAYKDMFAENGFDLTYVEEPGGHTWPFWDRQIEQALNWLPLLT